jgi:hypothetical protein
VTGIRATPRRIEPAIVRESDGIALKRVFGEWFVEARHPDLRALCGPLLEEIDRRRRAGAFDRRGGSPAVYVTMKTVGEPNAGDRRVRFDECDSIGVPARLLDSGFVVQDWDGPAVHGFFAWARRCAAILAGAHGVRAPEPVIGSAWSHITPTGGGMAYHDHGGRPDCVRAAATVFYLQLEPPDAAAPESGAVSYLSSVGEEEVLTRPEVGLLTSWPAHVRHRVLPYRGTIERIIIAANVNFLPGRDDAAAN